MPSKSRSSQANPSRFIRGRKIPFLRSKGEREGRREEQASSKDSPLWKWQARRVNIWQPPSELPLISSLFSISPRRNIGHGSTPSTTLPFQPAQTLSPREHLPRGEKLLVRGITRFRVSFVFGWNDLVSPITVIFIPQMGRRMENFGFESLDLCKFLRVLGKFRF